jgi:hypothetical protein
MVRKLSASIACRILPTAAAVSTGRPSARAKMLPPPAGMTPIKGGFPFGGSDDPVAPEASAGPGDLEAAITPFIASFSAPSPPSTSTRSAPAAAAASSRA